MITRCKNCGIGFDITKQNAVSGKIDHKNGKAYLEIECPNCGIPLIAIFSLVVDTVLVDGVCESDNCSE